MPANYVLLSTTQLTSSAASVTFSSIPQTGYTDLKIVVSGRNNTNPYSESWMQFGIGFNGQGNMVNVTGKGLSGNGTGASSLNMPADASNITYMPTSGATANVFGNTEFYIPNYTSNSNKSFSVDSVTENNATTSLTILSAGLWSQTAAITSITLTSRNGSFDTYSTFSIYGLAATGTSPTTAPKASGGNTVATDGTYWYHTFTSSGAFIPNQSISCDYLVVAGGGGGGWDTGGGGGAGGLRCTVGSTGGGGSLESALSVSAQRYLVTIGAGGTGMNVSTNRGANGTDSTFGSITSTGGGGGGSGGSSPIFNGSNGGSGGGMRANTTGGTRSSGTANQGYAGGLGTSPNQAGGGGGAGAIGSDGGASAGGNGGIGVATSISGTSTYYAGGGGGGNSTSAAAASGGNGGGGNGGWLTSFATSATANTGGGGGGGGGSSGNKIGYNGGSGIVIIRYAV